MGVEMENDHCQSYSGTFRVLSQKNTLTGTTFHKELVPLRGKKL